MIALDRPMRGCPVVVFDLETTGSKNDDRICELGVVVIERLYETAPVRVPHLCTLINPEKPGPWQGSFVHGIREWHVERAPTWDLVWPRLAELFSTHLPCAYNASFDLRFLRIEQDNVCSPLPVPDVAQVLDLLPLVRRIDAPEPGKKAPKGYHSLTAACERRRIAKGNHRAPGDAEATAKLLPRLIEELYKRPDLGAPPRPTVAQFLAYHRTPVRAAGAVEQVEALPLAVAEKAVPVPEAAPKESSSKGARLCWAVRGAPRDPKRSHLASMWLAKGRGSFGEWHWTGWPIEGKAQFFETEEEAAYIAGKCEGVPRFIESRARTV
jgi:DNA polymerase III epsilon subunit-like protein